MEFFSSPLTSMCVFLSLFLHLTPSLSAPQKLRPRGLELQQGELGDLVEQEMAATSAAVESAASRIEVGVCGCGCASLRVCVCVCVCVSACSAVWEHETK